MPKKKPENVLVAFYTEDGDSNSNEATPEIETEHQQGEEEITKHQQLVRAPDLNDDMYCSSERDFSELNPKDYEDNASFKDSSRIDRSDASSVISSDRLKKKENSSPLEISSEKEKEQALEQKIKKYENKLRKLKEGKACNLSSDEEYSVEQYQNQLFSDFAKKKEGSVQNDKNVIDVDNETIASVDDIRHRKFANEQLLNIELIKREIKRQQKLDIERMKKQKQDLKQLLQLEPRRKHTKKLQKRQKVVSKRTLQLLAKKFDEYYAYENNFQYKGPKVSLREIGQIFDIGANTIHKLYTEWMDDPTFYDRIIRYDLHKRVPERKLTLQRLQHVARLIKQNPFMTQNELCVELNKIEDLKSLKDGQRQEINKTTVARLLKVGKFKKKRVRCVPKERNTSKQLEKRYQFCAKYKELLDKQAKIYFLDESGFNLYMTREKAWSRPNEEITVNCPISKGKRFSLIAIIGEDGLANWRIIEGTYRKYEYLDFIRQLFEKLYQLKDEEHRQKWLIMDNCAIHDKEETMKLAQKWNVKVMYLPAYSPQLNPIQMWFHEVKTKIRKINYSGERQLLEIMERTLKDYEDHDFSNYYHGSLKFVEKGLRKEKF